MRLSLKRRNDPVIYTVVWNDATQILTTDSHSIRIDEIEWIGRRATGAEQADDEGNLSEWMTGLSRLRQQSIYEFLHRLGCRIYPR